MAIVTDSDAYGPGQPLWWVCRLYNEMIARRPYINKYDDYYRGDFPLPWLAPSAQEPFRRILKMSRANYMGLVVDAQCERQAVDGFRLSTNSQQKKKPKLPAPKFDDTTGALIPPDLPDDDPDDPIVDDDILRIWDANQMDTQMDQGLLEAAITGVSYIMVAPNPDDPTTPFWYVEHSSQCIIAFEPGTNRTVPRAALKVWVDDWTGQTFATLYLPDELWKFQSDGHTMMPTPQGMNFGSLRSIEAQIPAWEMRVGNAANGSTSGPNTLGLVPFWELPNNPRLLTGGQSELYDLTDSQDRIVKTLADRLMTQDFGAFPQKWASGWPEEDSSGNPTPPIAVGRDRMITTEVAETKFGQFAAADLDGYINSKIEDVKDIASRSRTPPQYLIGSMNNVNGDTLKAAESGLVAKVRQRSRSHNPGLTGSATQIRKMAGLGDLKNTGQRYEVTWRNPEFRTEGELVDALLKMSDLGVPEEALWERWGATPTEIERWMQMLQDKMARAAAGDATVLLADRFRQAAAPVSPGPAAPLQPGGGTQPANTNAPGSPSSATTNAATRTQSGGNSSANAAKQRPNAPKPSTT